MRAEPKGASGLQSKPITLKESKDFDSIYKQGNKWHGKLLVMFFLKKSQPRVGFVVSKRVGCAVVRNKIRRQLREIYRHNRGLLQMGDLVIVAKASAAQSCYMQINKDFIDTIHALGIACESHSKKVLR